MNAKMSDLLKEIGIKTDKIRYIKMWLTRKGYTLSVEVAPHEGVVHLWKTTTK